MTEYPYNAKRRYKKWTDDEIRILKAYYGILPHHVIAKMLNRTPWGVLHKAHKLKLKSDCPRGKIPKLLKRHIDKYYENRIKRYA